MGVKTLFIEPGSPWENGIVESFMRDTLCKIVPLRAGGGTRLEALNSWDGFGPAMIARYREFLQGRG